VFDDSVADLSYMRLVIPRRPAGDGEAAVFRSPRLRARAAVEPIMAVSYADSVVERLHGPRRVRLPCTSQGVQRMPRSAVGVSVLLLVSLATACSAPPAAHVASKRVEAPKPAQTVAEANSTGLPAWACTLEGYEAFFEVFVRQADQRAARTLPGAAIDKLDIAMRDNSWVLASKPDTLLDIDERRDGDRFTVSAKPVERDENDEVVKVLGPARTYAFRHVDGCWKFASSE